MSDELAEILKRIGAATSKASSQTSSNINPPRELPGDPECPYCGGIGYLRQEVPLGHPDFGKLQLCSCRQSQLSELARQRLFEMSNLNELQELTFETFKPRGQIGIPDIQADTLERAYNSALHFSQTLNGWLLLQGSYGCGKTHLAAAIANFAVSLGVPTLFITVPDMLDTLRFAYSDPEITFEDRFEQIKNVHLLILDDFGTQNATGWAQEKLFQIVNYRYINRLPTVVTTNLSLEEIEERIRSRLKDPQLVSRVQILASDFRNPEDDTGHPAISSLTYLANRTFGTFSDRSNEGLPADELRSLAKAFEAARKYADQPRPSGWLVFIGPYGCGKTHLAAAIANYRAGMGYSTLFIFVPDLLDHLRATFNPNSTVRYDKRFEEVRSAPLLILDSLDSQAMTPWVREKLYQIFNHRYIAELPTVITTAERLEDMDSRLRSRLMDTRLTTVYAITAPAYSGKEGKGKGQARSRKS